MPSSRESYDVIVVGGGHNGLTAAAYLTRAGLSVLVLERLDHVGGAAVSALAFPGMPARLSRYSYLVSLMPAELVSDLGLPIELASRSTASYTPWERDGRHGGLLVERPEGVGTMDSFRDLTGSDSEYAAWHDFYEEVADLAEVVAPTLMQPLPSERDIRAEVPDAVWQDLVTTPLGATLESRFDDDTVRGVVATDALIGTFAGMNDASLIQNRCFLYHLIGNGTGEWRVPVGGMGSVTAALAEAASGAEIITGAGVSSIHPTALGGATVYWNEGGVNRSATGRFVLANVAPWVLRILLGQPEDPSTKPAGAQLKVNFLLDRLPALKSGIDPAIAFAGTLHLNEDYGQLAAAYEQAAGGRLPDLLPGEVYCHSLTDPSILGGFEGHTLTYFGLHTPPSLFDGDLAGGRSRARDAVLASLNAHLAEPIESVVAHGPDGEPCIEVKLPQDVEADLAMPGGHIFHGDLEWPWAPGRSRLESPAQRWGVQTDHEAVLLCGSGARRGGAVSGLGGHNAAMAVLESL